MNRYGAIRPLGTPSRILTRLGSTSHFGTVGTVTPFGRHQQHRNGRFDSVDRRLGPGWFRAARPADAVIAPRPSLQSAASRLLGNAGSVGARLALFKTQPPPIEISVGARSFSSTSMSAETNRRRTDPRPDLQPARQPSSPAHDGLAGGKGKTPHEGGQTLFERLPHVSRHLHRPTKEELLAAATGFWSRFGVHFKWFSIKSTRPFNVDDISAFFSWILVGHFVWIIVGTTTFFSLAILLVNTVFAQETLARWVGNYLTHASGLQVVFESAIVPRWNDGVISFKNVFVSCRPGYGRARVSKGSQASAQAAAAAAYAVKSPDGPVEQEEDSNYSQFDLTIETVNVTLSFTKWFNGKGPLRDVEVVGIRGIVDRTCVLPAEPGVDPAIYKHEHNPGDFEIDSFRMEDLLVTVYQPGDFRPFTVSIYSCDLPRLRKQWLFYDFLSATTMHGSFDNSLFTIHPRQDHTYGVASQPAGRWRKQNRIRVDGLNIDHLNYGTNGPFSWIREGTVDLVADIMFPEDEDGTLVKAMSDFYNKVEATVTSSAFSAMHLAADHPIHHHNQHQTADGRHSSEQDGSAADDDEGPERRLVLDMFMGLNNVRATVPLFTRDMSYVNNALVRPIVAYINSHRNYIPISCQVSKQLAEFDGSWTMYDNGLMDDLGIEAYGAFVRNITDDEHARRRRFRKVGIWTLQLAVQALFIGLAGHVA